MKPTKEQIQWFWEQCGLHYEDFGSPAFPNQGGAWVDLDNNAIDLELLGETPPIDLNNLFKYAVPKLKSWDCLVDWAIEMANAYADSRMLKDPALALFWAIYKALAQLSKGG